jgi:hypothetical protein
LNTDSLVALGVTVAGSLWPQNAGLFTPRRKFGRGQAAIAVGRSSVIVDITSAVGGRKAFLNCP